MDGIGVRTLLICRIAFLWYYFNGLYYSLDYYLALILYCRHLFFFSLGMNISNLEIKYHQSILIIP